MTFVYSFSFFVIKVFHFIMIYYYLIHAGVTCSVCIYLPVGFIKSDLRRQNANLLAKAAVSVIATQKRASYFVLLLKINSRGRVAVVL